VSNGDVVVIGPHWVVCAQLHAALGPRIRVGCMTKTGDDFENWYPRARWESADTLVFVSDNRFDIDAAGLFPDRVEVLERAIPVFRGGKLARRFTLTVLDRKAHAQKSRTAPPGT
jgi:hypothetical protein